MICSSNPYKSQSSIMFTIDIQCFLLKNSELKLYFIIIRYSKSLRFSIHRIIKEVNKTFRKFFGRLAGMNINKLI